LNAIPFSVCLFFFPVGSGVDVSKEIVIKIVATEVLYFGYQQQGKQPPL
jgi:hypothetical protein